MNKREADRILANMALRGYGKATVEPMPRVGEGWVVVNPAIQRCFYSMEEWEAWYYDTHEEYQVWRRSEHKIPMYILIRNGVIVDIINEGGGPVPGEWIGQTNLIAKKNNFRRRWDQKEVARVIEIYKQKKQQTVSS